MPGVFSVSRSSRQTSSSWGAQGDGWGRRSSGWVGLQGRQRRQGQWPTRGAEADAVAGAFRRSAERAEWPRSQSQQHFGNLVHGSFRTCS